jgi:hypothetical protein
MNETLYTQVRDLCKTETDCSDDTETNLYDWLSNGDTDGRTAESLAAEWDELNGQKPEIDELS